MKPQIYNFETRFNFGKHKGRSLMEVLKSQEGRYIGYLIVNDVPWFILDPDTMNILEKKGFFDNLEMSFYTSGGSFPLSGMDIKKLDVLNQLKKRYDEFVQDPIAYEKWAQKNLQEYSDKNRRKL